MNRLCKDYLLITFLSMAVCWGFCMICGLNGLYMDQWVPIYVIYVLGALSPTIASYFALKRNNEVSGFWSWLKSLFDMRHSVISYIIVLVFPAIYYIIQCLLSGYRTDYPFYMMIVMLPVMMIGGGLEEAGWRHILQPELEKKYSFTLSTLIVSVIWALWHLPLFFIQGTSQFGTSFFYFSIAILASSFSFAAIKKITGSTFLCILAHSVNNAIASTYFFQGDLLSYCVSTAVMIILSYGLVILYKNHSKK